MTVGVPIGRTLSPFRRRVQMASQEAGLLELYDETLDDLVPLSTVINFAHDFIEAYWEMLQSVGVVD